MEIIGYILLGLVIIAIVVYLLYLFRLAIAVITCILAAYLFFFKDSLLGACVVIGIWYILDFAIQRIGNSFKEPTGKVTLTKLKRKKKNVASYKRGTGKSDFSKVNWNFILMCVIPIFWPFLIFRILFTDKPVNELTANDYEQHLRCNGK